MLMFPEGTRSTSGELQPFKIGVAVLAMERNVPIIPVYIGRTYALLPKGQRFVKPGTISVVFGQPIYPADSDPSTDRYAAFGALAKQVEDGVAMLVGRGAPG